MQGEMRNADLHYSILDCNIEAEAATGRTARGFVWRLGPSNKVVPSLKSARASPAESGRPNLPTEPPLRCILHGGSWLVGSFPSVERARVHQGTGGSWTPVGNGLSR
jgi:hypothetical protein